MGILRKYLWLVVPIVFFANYASADTCENDPYACTPAKLCSKTTEKVNNVLYWISSQEDKHLKVARKIKLNCGAKDAMSSCQKDASECSILELCEVAATKEGSATYWNEINPQHVKLAKSFGLDCGVNEVQGINQVNKTNTFKSTRNDKVCSQDILKCTPTELCERATYTINGITGWKVGEYKKFVDEAKRRNTSCGVKSASNDKTCSQDVTKCTPAELCDAASYTVNKVTEWKQGKYLSFVQEAKRRNISCGVKSASNDQVKDGEKARIAFEAEKKRKADEKARIAFEAEEKRIADEKARIALEAEKKRIADEKARIALEAEKKRIADEKARIAFEAEEKRIADEKARIALEAEKKRKADEKARIALEAEKKRIADEKKRLALEAEKKPKSDAQKLHEANNPVAHGRLVGLALRSRDPEAMFYLSLSFINGAGTDKNVGLAQNWLEKAAKKGWTEAQYKLGKNFQLGREDYKVDIEAAQKWYKAAASQGHNLSSEALSIIIKEQKELADKKEQSGPWTGDTGYFILNGRKLSYLDLVLMDIFELANKEVTIYGYIRFSVEQVLPGFGYYLQLYDGKNSGETLDVIISYESFHKPNESISSAKRRAYLPIRNAENKQDWNLRYLIELKGKFKIYRDKEKVFFNPKEIRMIPEFNK